LTRILASHERVACEMAPGDAVFFHANTLHASGANSSDRPRTLLHCSYNAIANAPYIAGQEHHAFRPLEVLPDTALRNRAYDSSSPDLPHPTRRPASPAMVQGAGGTRGIRREDSPRDTEAQRSEVVNLRRLPPAILLRHSSKIGKPGRKARSATLHSLFRGNDDKERHRETE
jgi:hypothetical protein